MEIDISTDVEIRLPLNWSKQSFCQSYGRNHPLSASQCTWEWLEDWFKHSQVPQSKYAFSWCTVPPGLQISVGSSFKYIINIFPKLSDGLWASFFINFAIIHRFQSSGMSDLMISLVDRSLHAALERRVSAWSHRVASTRHWEPRLSHGPPGGTPDSLWTLRRRIRNEDAD